MNNGTYVFEKLEKKDYKTIKKVKLNYKVDESTINNRIYKREDLIRALDELSEKRNIPIVRNSSELFEDGYPIRLKDLIGIYMEYEIISEGDIYINIKPTIDTELFDNSYLTMCINGTINDENIVEIHNIVGFFIVGKHDVVDENFNIVKSKKFPKQELIILTGNVGCGKSTFAKNKIEESFKYVIVNDDDISTMIGGGIYTNYDENKKSLYKDIELVCTFIGLNSGFNVIVDMPNVKLESRKRFIEIGKKFNAKIISIDWGSGKSEDLSRRLNDNRGYDKWKEAFFRKKQEYEMPSMDEGFDEIIRNYI